MFLIVFALINSGIVLAIQMSWARKWSIFLKMTRFLSIHTAFPSYLYIYIHIYIYTHTYISSGLGTVPISSTPSAVSAAVVPKAVVHGRKLSFCSRYQRVFGHKAQGQRNIFGSANWGQRGSMHLTSIQWMLIGSRKMIFPLKDRFFCWVLRQFSPVRGWTFFPWNREKLKPPGGQSVDSYTNQIWCWSIEWILMLIMYVYIYMTQIFFFVVFCNSTGYISGIMW